jgi:hypothetical protein
VYLLVIAKNKKKLTQLFITEAEARPAIPHSVSTGYSGKLEKARYR